MSEISFSRKALSSPLDHILPHLTKRQHMFVAHSLWDVKNNQEYMSVQCDRGLTGFDWISWKAGNFVTTNGSGSVVERNVSQNEPLRTVRFVSGKTSVTKATFFPGKSRSFAFSCLDGRVGIYNMEKHVVEFMNVSCAFCYSCSL